MPTPGPGSTISHHSSGASSCLDEAGTYQEGVLCRSSACSVLGLLRRPLLISYVYNMFLPCLAQDTLNLPIHRLALECEMAPSCPCEHLGPSCWHCLGRLGKFYTWARWWILPNGQGVARGLEPNLLPDSFLVMYGALGVMYRAIGPSWLLP